MRGGSPGWFGGPLGGGGEVGGVPTMLWRQSWTLVSCFRVSLSRLTSFTHCARSWRGHQSDPPQDPPGPARPPKTPLTPNTPSDTPKYCPRVPNTPRPPREPRDPLRALQNPREAPKDPPPRDTPGLPKPSQDSSKTPGGPSEPSKTPQNLSRIPPRPPRPPQNPLRLLQVPPPRPFWTPPKPPASPQNPPGSYQEPSWPLQDLPGISRPPQDLPGPLQDPPRTHPHGVQGLSQPLPLGRFRGQLHQLLGVGGQGWSPPTPAGPSRDPRYTPSMEPLPRGLPPSLLKGSRWPLRDPRGLGGPR